MDVTIVEVSKILNEYDNYAHPTQGIATCPFCGRKRHFYINKKTLQWDCKKCGEEGGIKKLLDYLGEQGLLGELKILDENYTYEVKIFGIEEKQKEEIILEMPKIKFPVGTRNIKIGDAQFEYLLGRKYSKQFIMQNLHYFFKNNIFPSFSNKIIIGIFEKGKLVGYVGRDFNDNAAVKYKNSQTDFKKLLFGYDELEENKITAIGEGVFDRCNLKIFNDEYNIGVNSTCTFGKKFSLEQAEKLRIKGIKNIVIFWDFDAIKQIKKLIDKDTIKLFDSVEVALIEGKFPNGKYKDLGASTAAEILYYYRKKKEILTFFYEKVEINL